MNENYISIGKASELSGISIQTLRSMVDENKIDGFKTPAGHRRINKHCLESLIFSPVGSKEEPKSNKKNFIYTRVSSRKQLDDLTRQIEYLKKPQYASYSVIQDVGSGINFKREGLKKILQFAIQGSIGEVVVAHKDRLSRFAFDLIEYIITLGGGKITVVDNDTYHSTEQELAEDLLSIVHVYSCRQMGKRRYCNEKP